MQKFFKKPIIYISLVILLVSSVSLTDPGNIENSLILLGKSLENLTTIIQSKPATPIKPETPKKPLLPKKPVTPKVPPKKPIVPEKPTIPQTSQSDTGHLALQYTNDFRAENGKAPLKWNQKMADLCVEHSKNMAEGKVPFGHDGFEDRVARYPSTAWGAAENVFMTSSNRQVARDAVNGWIKSPGHRKNLLGNYNTCAIGVYKGQRGWYATQLFARF